MVDLAGNYFVSYIFCHDTGKRKINKSIKHTLTCQRHCKETLKRVTRSEISIEFSLDQKALRQKKRNRKCLLKK